MNFIKKHWSNILFGILIVLLFIPQTGKPIKIFVNRLLSFAPSTESEKNRETLESFDWNLVDLEGNMVDLNQYKGNKILINFWATWCPPCIAEMPSMQALYNDYKDKAVFLFVTNDNRPEVDQFLSKENYNLPIYQSASSPPAQLQSSSLPTTFLINEEGDIIIKKVGSANWNSEKVRKLLD
jgi:thiol-disulfide isomerase/thioredoxin